MRENSARTAAAEPLGPGDSALGRTVELFSAIAHPVRLAVLVALSRRGPMSVGQLQSFAEVEQSAMSHQLRILRDARLVEAERNGKQVMYRLHDSHVAHIVEDALQHDAEERR